MKSCLSFLLGTLLAFVPIPLHASGLTAQTLPLAMGLPNLFQALVSSFAFGLLGIVLAIIGFKLFDRAIPFDLEKELCENKNIAVGILCAAIVLGVCHIIAASMS